MIMKIMEIEVIRIRKLVYHCIAIQWNSSYDFKIKASGILINALQLYQYLEMLLTSCNMLEWI